MAAFAIGVCGFVFAYTLTATAQQADQPAADGGLGEIVVAARPNGAASVELVRGPDVTLSGPPTDGGATVAEPKTPASGFGGFIEAGVGSYGRQTLGGGVTVPLAAGKGELRIEGYEAHTGVR
jgi:outer membrane receptor protein involved in Fe transport